MRKLIKFIKANKIFGISITLGCILLLWRNRFKLQSFFYNMSTGKKLWINPVKGAITSKFGNRVHPVTGVTSFHNGVDVACPIDTPIKCPQDGKVVLMNNHPTGGLQLVIEHANGMRTGYAHLSAYASGATLHDSVVQGQEIAYTGNSGATTGAHLHFTLTDKNGVKIDPLLVFDFKTEAFF